MRTKSNFRGCKAIVTGGAGFIGSHLVKRLLLEGADVHIIDNLWRGSLTNLDFGEKAKLDLNSNFNLADLSDYGKCMELIRNADIVYHLADVVAGVDYVFDHQPFVYHQNVMINTNVLWACIKNKIPNYVYVGTACSFPKSLQMKEGISAIHENQTFPADPESAYGWAKLMGEYEAELSQKNDAFNVGLLRFHNVYGPKSCFDVNRSQALPSLIRKAVKYPQEDFVVWGSGKQYRDFVYVEDVVDALMLIYEKGMNKGVIQIGSSKAVTLREAAEVIIRASGKPIDVKFDTTKPEGDRGRIAILTRAMDILDWMPATSFETGIENTYRWIEQKIRLSENKN
jgi:GDP-D-mannose 3', 5'-epimerase